MEFLRSFLRRHLAVKPVVASWCCSLCWKLSDRGQSHVFCSQIVTEYINGMFLLPMVSKIKMIGMLLNFVHVPGPKKLTKTYNKGHPNHFTFNKLTLLTRIAGCRVRCAQNLLVWIWIFKPNKNQPINRDTKSKGGIIAFSLDKGAVQR